MADRCLKCSCQLFESIGISCCHSFCIMKAEHMLVFPSSSILKRWTKEAKIYPQFMPCTEEDSIDVNSIIRCGSLNMLCDKLAFYASKTGEGYNEATRELEKLICRMEELWKKNEEKDAHSIDPRDTSYNIIKDPKISKTKGSRGPSTSNIVNGRCCGHCKNMSHTKRTCSQQNIHGDAAINLCTDDEDVDNMPPSLSQMDWRDSQTVNFSSSTHIASNNGGFNVMSSSLSQMDWTASQF
jgi:hypothetical protein